VRKPQVATATGLTLCGAEAAAASGFAGGLGDGLVARVVAFFKEFF
jgi:hypothetical protein